MAQARVVLSLLLCVIIADYTDALGSGDPAPLVPAGNPTGDSADGRSSPLPLLLLVLVIPVIVLVVMVGGCCIAICCVCGYCRYRRVDRSVNVDPEIELIENPAFIESESNKKDISPNMDPPCAKHVPGFTQSSQSVVANATPRLAVNRPISTSVFTVGNKGALQFGGKFELSLCASPNPYDLTQSLPRMSHNQDQRHLQPEWPASAGGLSQTSLPPYLESTAPNSPQETEV